MLTIIKQTRDERIAMFMKLTKAELVEMLLNNQDLYTALLLTTAMTVTRPAIPVFVQ